MNSLFSLLSVSPQAAAINVSASSSAAQAAKDPSVLTVVFMGLGTVFFGLICIIVISIITSTIIRIIQSKKSVSDDSQTSSVPAAQDNSTDSIGENRQEIVAAVSAVIAEELGEDIRSIRILSFKKL